MPEFSFEDALTPSSANAQAAPPVPEPSTEAKGPSSFSFEEASQPAPKPESQPSGPMPGFFDALWQGIRGGVSDVGQTVTSFSSVAPKPSTQEESPAASDLEWKDVTEPTAKLAPKVAYRLGRSSPALAAGVAGGMAGSAAGTAVAGPAGTAAGALAGGVGGSVIGAAVQTLGPSFAQELKKSPDDPDGAWNRALENAAISGAFSGAAWAAFPVKFFQGPVKQLAFQVFGVQPGISVAQQAVQNIREDRPVTENLGKAYGEGAVMTAVPALGHAVVRGSFGGPEAIPDTPPISPQDRLARINSGLAQAQQLRNQSMQPNIPPHQAAELGRQADTLLDLAQRDQLLMNAPQHIAQWRQLSDQAHTQSENPALPMQQRINLKEQSASFRENANQYEFLLDRERQDPYKPPEGRFAWIKQSFIDNIAPELASDKALQSDPLIARFKSATGKAKDTIHRQAEEYYYKANKMAPQDTIDFIQSHETNSPVPPALLQKYPWLQQRAPELKRMLNESFRLEKSYGSAADYLENYFPHLWENPIRARNFFMNKAPPTGTGSEWFQKGRFYDLIQDGLNNGLRLSSHNLEDLVSRRLVSGANMVERARLLEDLHRNGVAVPADRATPDILNPGRDAKSVWKQVSGPGGRQWLIAPDIQSLWENGVVSKGLWANEGGVGKAFRGWMDIKNAIVPIKLGLSLFHPVHVFHINLVNNMRRAARETFGAGQQGILRRMVALPEAAVQSAMDTVMAFPIGTPHLGKDIRTGWITPEARQTPEQRFQTKILNEAGVSPQLSEELRISAKHDLANAIRDNQYLKAIPALGRRMMETISSPFFEKWIPNLKAAAVMREAEMLFRQRPDLLSNDNARRLALRTIGKSVDNRYGEMFYGGLFWNRTLKDSMIGSFLSLGWNLGFVRDFVGGALEPTARGLREAPTVSRKVIRDTSSKTSNLILYVATAMMWNAVVTKMLTGDDPEGMDYIFPRIGGLNPDSSPRRMTNPFYTREVPMAQKNIEDQGSTVAGLAQMLSHKLMVAPFAEMYQNKDYFGNQIYDENAPGFKQAWQFATHMLSDQMSPMSLSGAKRALELSGKPHSTLDAIMNLHDPDVYSSLLGFGPAPAYASKSAVENRISGLYNKFVIPKERPFIEAEANKQKSEARTAYLLALQGKDPEKITAAAQKMAELGMKSSQIRKIRPGGQIEYMFQRLPESQQSSLLQSMSKEEFKRFYPKASRKTRAEKGIIDLQRRYYQ